MSTPRPHSSSASNATQRDRSTQDLDARRAEMFRTFAETHDPSLRDELIFSYLGMVRQLAVRFSSRHEALEDLVQVGIIGLIKAVDRFDPGRGFGFASFAVPTIVGEIKRHFRDKGWAMHVPRRVKDLNVLIGRTVDHLVVELGRSVTPADLAQRLGVSVEDIVEAQESSRAYTLQSLDSEVDHGVHQSPQALGDVVGKDDRNLDAVLDKTCIKTACEGLSARERVIIYLRFFESVSQSEIAQRLRCTQMHVSRLQRRALEKMRFASKN